MDFILSLTHFCEVHGPTSIICSQVLPFSCSQCYPEKSDFSPQDTPATSHDTLSSHGLCGHASGKPSPPKSPARPAEGGDKSPKIEDYPCFVKGQSTTADPQKLNVMSGADGDTCASCRLTLPEDVSKQLPPGAPGTARGDGKGRNGSPVLRSREVVYSCGSNHSDPDDSVHDSHIHGSLPDSLHSSSVASDSSCHTHILTYLSLRGPPNPVDYALLRRSSIRTLSCELLPRGLSSGPLCFGDSNAGYTIAYIFRLPDHMARGKRRSYALVALAGKDSRRAFRACPIIWRAFDRIATAIYNAAEKFQEEEKSREEQNNVTNRPGARPYTPVSSFLTGRAVDPDGQLRRPGQVRARNLTEIVGNPYIFAEIHAHFVALLQQLGSMFGALPISEERFVCSTVREEEDMNPSRPPVSFSTPASEKQKANDDNDLGLSTLDLSSGPKPIPIAPRRSVIA
ncbi:hypothetical protein P175DRAFT_065883 [Aspergillus ochraceoroseus IBT 24754]|uniref:UDENN FLCN/SMCR8-type domain-containing protein n=1 Tax=Aspergillus ochraceoroseus IBT 24754 TaxID=1392256 RepID=A0A2T5M9G8_9EURO|nr:uncharacterized protein P175DRAFT_065883 [Aspergillus ochraceoroseus IBT 24754]PTU25178.1 hypothetical protein P175DRAFT_065883 [Aspergillus ochraceoroseus IBT 24754]